jgi:Fe-S cluster biogenesis protein NfuA
MQSSIAITLEFTPNPNTLKFVVNRPLLERGTANFPDAAAAAHAPLAQEVFKVEGISAVMLGSNFVTITKAPTGDWDVIAEQVPQAVERVLASGTPIVDGEWLAARQAPSAATSEVEQRILEVLDSEIRPAVAMDGGDITFGRFENGVVYLQLQGSCSACPSSTATLKLGVEARLKERVPEVLEVIAM